MSTVEIRRAAKFGRLLLAVTGVALVSVACVFAYSAPGELPVVVICGLAVGIAQVALAITGPDKVCAWFGFYAPWWPT